MIKILLWLVVAGCVLAVGYWSFNLYRKVQVSKGLIEAAVPFTKSTPEIGTSILIVGDSTGVGVGSESPETTVAGRAAEYFKAARVENYSVSGAVVKDLPEQIEKAERDTYSVIIVQIGANDIIRFHDAEKTAAELSAILATLPDTEKIILLSAGDVGATSLFPIFIRPFHTHLNEKYHEYFGALSLGKISYVNLNASPSKELFKQNPEKYIAADGLHPTGDGYGLWFEQILKQAY